MPGFADISRAMLLASRCMSSFRIRPVFEQVVELAPDEVRERIVRAVERDGGGRFEVKNFPDFVCLRVREQDRHFWSPRLNLSLEAADGGHTRIAGTYGPNANVWGLFLYGYLLTGSLGTFTGVLGFAQWMIGLRPWGLWIFGGLAALAAALYLTAQFGQKLGARQMFMIHQAYEGAIGTMVEIK
jgi:hypothetical protein